MERKNDLNSGMEHVSFIYPLMQMAGKVLFMILFQSYMLFFYADILIVLGVSGGLIFPFVRLFTNKKIIVNIDGLEWRRNKWNKWVKKFLRFSEKLAVRFSHADITDNAVIKKYTALVYKSLSHEIAYGADHAKKQYDYIRK